MDWQLIGIVVGIICVPLAVFGAYVGIRQMVQWRRDAKANLEVRVMLESMNKKVDGITIYIDGLPEMAEKRRGTLLNSGLKSMQHYEYDKAIGFFRQCLGGEAKPGGKVALLVLIGNCFLSTSRLIEAEGSYKEAELIAKKINDKEGLSVALGNVAIVYGTKGKFDKALEHSQLCLNMLRELGNREGEAGVLDNIGIVYRTKGQLDKAMEHFQLSLKIHREIGNREGEAISLGNMGNVYQMKGNLDEAMDHYQLALKMQREIGNREGEANDLGNIGNICGMKGEHSKALEHYQLALKIFEEIGAAEGTTQTREIILNLQQWLNHGASTA